MFCCKTTNNRISQLDERVTTSCLMTYLSFDDLFVHYYNIQALASEMPKVYKNLLATSYKDLFIKEKNTYDFRRNRILKTEIKHSLERS